MPIEPYYRDVPRGDEAALDAEREHVIAHLSAIADTDDDPTTHAADVRVYIRRHPERLDLVRIVGELDAEPTAPYLAASYDPYGGVDHDLFAREIAAAEADLAALRG